jgi:hypothetical protein
VDANEHSRSGPEVGGPGAALPDEQVALNEATARTINESIEGGRLTEDGVVTFVCECGQLGCNAMIDLTVREYEAVRAHPRRFAVARGHHAHFDDVIDELQRYTVVSKHGAPGMIAEQSDPRAEESTSQ